MSENKTDQNPMDFLKSFWGNLSVPLPGMVTPTVDTDELGRRVSDLKAVEGWLKSNLSMLQMTIQGLEMQRATLLALQSMTQQPTDGKAPPEPNPFANPALWPWNLMPPAPPPAQAAAEKPKEDSAPKGKPKR